MVETIYRLCEIISRQNDLIRLQAELIMQSDMPDNVKETLAAQRTEATSQADEWRI